MALSHEAALRGRADLAKYTHNAHLLFALETAFDIEDIHAVAVDALTDGQYDKKCDLIYVDTDSGMIVVAQGYVATTAKTEAPANKASDLNTAAAWLFAADLNQVPAQIQSAVSQARAAIEADQIQSIRFWFVHNCPESSNVQEELEQVNKTVQAQVRSHFPLHAITDFHVMEVGQNRLEEFYRALETPIYVTDEFEIDVPGGFEEISEDWKAFVTSLDGGWLFDQQRKYGDRISSANLRDYLGSRKTAKNINHGIKQTAETDSSNFWVFNNGITALVHDYTYDQVSNKLKNQWVFDCQWSPNDRLAWQISPTANRR